MNKKRTIMLAVVLPALLLCLLVSQSAAGIQFGIKGGLSLAKIKTVPDTFMGYSWEYKSGAAGGISMEIGLPGPFSIQPEVLYVQKGAKISITEGDISGGLKVNVDYIEIPLLLKISLMPGGVFKPSVYAGPFIGFLRKAESVIHADGYSEKEDIKDDLTDTDYGITFGLGLVQNLGVMKLTLDARYDYGLRNIMKVISEDGPQSVKSRTWLFMAGIAF